MVDAFVRYLGAERRYSPLTLHNYRRDVEQFVAWWSKTSGEEFSPERVEKEHLREWIVHRSETGGLSASSLNRELSSLRTLFRWLRREGKIERDLATAITSVRTPKRLPSFVPESRMRPIVEQTLDPRQCRLGLRGGARSTYHPAALHHRPSLGRVGGH